jgi:leucyl aminopeptidase
MMTMKDDMSGAAAVLSTMAACGRLGVKVRVIGYMPLTENMPGDAATRPGDILRIRNGKTIEVLNTDAEGRLVLADALSLAVEEAPDAIIDLATLTGACVVALGKEIAGVLGNDDELIAAVERAGALAGEALWELPVPSGYHDHIDSDIADMKNIGATGQAGSLSAALLLQEFVGEVPWVHLDIAGPAFAEKNKHYVRKGGTGFGVRTLLELLHSYQPLGRAVLGDAKGIKVLR